MYAEAGTLYSLLSEGKADTGQCRYNDVDIDIDAFDACGGIMVTSKRAFVDRLEKQRGTCIFVMVDCPLRWMRTLDIAD